MAIRNDLSINWEASPRIITVAAPSTEIVMQDLYDTLRVMEASSSAVDEPFIVDAGGKESLGGGVRVGLTVTLQNALLAFQSRPGPTFVQCSISGGNLVAIDELGEYFKTPIYPTDYTQIILANSSSATLQEQTAIQFSSYDNGVAVDYTSPWTGTEFPVGTRQKPVNNLADAMAIAQAPGHGFSRIYVIGNLVIDNGGNYTAMEFIGESKTKSTFTISAEANVYRCEFTEAEVDGVLDGQCKISNCLIKTLTYVSGFIEDSVIEGTVLLGGGSTAHFLRCFSGIPGSSTPTIDMGGAGTSLALRDYSGGILIANKTGPEAVSIDLDSGQVKLDLSTVTNGTIVVRGDGKVVNAANDDWLPSGQYGNLLLINETTYGVMLQELWMLAGLDRDNPMTVTPTTRVAGPIDQTISGDGTNSTTVTRQ